MLLHIIYLHILHLYLNMDFSSLFTPQCDSLCDNWGPLPQSPHFILENSKV